MSTATLVSVEEYLKLEAKPAYEFIAGVLRQKQMPTANGSLVQAMLIVLLSSRAPQFRAMPEAHVKIREDEYLVPNVLLARRDSIERPYATKPVYLCVEIASPGDRPGQLLAKCEEYHKWGVPYCWVIDPDRKSAWVYHRDSVEWIKLEGSGMLVAGDIELPLEDVFQDV